MALPNGHIGRVIGKRGYVGTNGYPRWPGGSKQRREARPTILAGGAAAGSSRELLRAVGPHVEGRLVRSSRSSSRNQAAAIGVCELGPNHA